MPKCPQINPDYYKTNNGIEVIDTIEALVADPVSYLQGNVIKYLGRMGKKTADPLPDARKLEWYANRLVKYLESVRAVPISDCRCHAVARGAGPPVSQADGFGGHVSS